MERVNEPLPLTAANDAAAIAARRDAELHAADPTWEHDVLDTSGVKALRDASLARNTVRGYASDWRHYSAWCIEKGLEALTADGMQVAVYLSQLAAETGEDGEPLLVTGSIERRVAAIAKAHTLAGLPTPTTSPQVTQVLAGIRRSRAAAARTKQARPLELDDLRAIMTSVDVEHYPDAVAAARDTALLAVGLLGAFRGNELASLRTRDVRLHQTDGLHIHLATSKADQEGEGHVKAIPRGEHPETCAVCAWVRWSMLRDAADDVGRPGVLALVAMRKLVISPDKHLCRQKHALHADDTPAFRSLRASGYVSPKTVTGRSISDLIKRRVSDLGLPPSEYSSHSMRAGFVTETLRAGADAFSIMAQTGHKTQSMIDVYRREYHPLAQNAVTRLAL